MKAKLFAAESIPRFLETSEFALEPLHPDHVILDYDAVMSSKSFLRRWSCSDWPADDFSLGENREDLRRHSQEFSDQLAYTYTILSPDRSTCLGCIYLNLLERIEPLNDQERNLLSSKSAFVRFWLRRTLQESERELSIFRTIVSWFKQEWKANGVLYSCNRQVPATIKLFDATGLKIWLELSYPNRDELLWYLPEEQ